MGSDAVTNGRRWGDHGTRHGQLLAYLVVCAAFVFGILRVEGLDDEIKADQRAVQAALCESGNENRAILLDIVRVAAPDDLLDDPRLKRLREHAEATLMPVDCQSLITGSEEP